MPRLLLFAEPKVWCLVGQQLVKLIIHTLPEDECTCIFLYDQCAPKATQAIPFVPSALQETTHNTLYRNGWRHASMVEAPCPERLAHGTQNQKCQPCSCTPHRPHPPQLQADQLGLGETRLGQAPPEKGEGKRRRSRSPVLIIFGSILVSGFDRVWMPLPRHLAFRNP